jgi:HTH-like domain
MDQAAWTGRGACFKAPEKREHLRCHRAGGISISRGCELMSLSSSTFYDPPPTPVGPDELVTRIGAICDEFECYGYRRVGAALRQQGVVVNGKKLRRLMREYGQRRSVVSLTCRGREGQKPRGVAGAPQVMTRNNKNLSL